MRALSFLERRKCKRIVRTGQQFVVYNVSQRLGPTIKVLRTAWHPRAGDTSDGADPFHKLKHFNIHGSGPTPFPLPPPHLAALTSVEIKKCALTRTIYPEEWSMATPALRSPVLEEMRNVTPKMVEVAVGLACMRSLKELLVRKCGYYRRGRCEEWKFVDLLIAMEHYVPRLEVFE